MSIKNQVRIGKYRNPVSNRKVTVFRGEDSRNGKIVRFVIEGGKNRVISHKDFPKWKRISY